MGVAHGAIVPRHVVCDEDTGQLCLIDFWLAMVRDESSEEEWQECRAKDLQGAEDVIEQWVCSKC